MFFPSEEGETFLLFLNATDTFFLLSPAPGPPFISFTAALFFWSAMWDLPAEHGFEFARSGATLSILQLILLMIWLRLSPISQVIEILTKKCKCLI